MIVFKEILPNPSGKDTDGEWIKLANTGDSSTNLSGWVLKDESQKEFLFNNLVLGDQTIPEKTDLLLSYSITRISLNNNGDTLRLYDASEKLVDEISYEGPVSDDEIIFGSQFVLEEQASPPDNRNLDTLAFTGQGLIKNPDILTPIFIGSILALFFGVGTGLLMRQIFRKEDEKTRVRF